MVALRPSAFGSEAGFGERMARLCAAILDAGEPGATRLPGSRAAAHEAATDGALEIGDGLAATLRTLAAELGVAPAAPQGALT